jgi:hypothetical protein
MHGAGRAETPPSSAPDVWSPAGPWAERQDEWRGFRRGRAGLRCLERGCPRHEMRRGGIVEGLCLLDVDGTIRAVTRSLLLPDDEREFVEWASGCALTLIRGDRLIKGGPQPVGIAGLPAELPGPPEPGGPPTSALELLLWSQSWGVNNLPEWDVSSAISRVRRHLDDAAASSARISANELIDLERTRILRLRRSGWTRDGALRVAARRGSARLSRLEDKAVMEVLRDAERWMRHGATEIPVPEAFRYLPRVFARPGRLCRHRGTDVPLGRVIPGARTRPTFEPSAANEDLHRRCWRQGSISTPGLRTPAGSSAFLAARSARANGSGLSVSYQRRCSRPTA